MNLLPRGILSLRISESKRCSRGIPRDSRTSDSQATCVCISALGEPPLQFNACDPSCIPPSNQLATVVVNAHGRDIVQLRIPGTRGRYFPLGVTSPPYFCIAYEMPSILSGCWRRWKKATAPIIKSGTNNTRAGRRGREGGWNWGHAKFGSHQTHSRDTPQGLLRVTTAVV